MTFAESESISLFAVADNYQYKQLTILILAYFVMDYIFSGHVNSTIIFEFVS